MKKIYLAVSQKGPESSVRFRLLPPCVGAIIMGVRNGCKYSTLCCQHCAARNPHYQTRLNHLKVAWKRAAESTAGRVCRPPPLLEEPSCHGTQLRHGSLTLYSRCTCDGQVLHTIYSAIKGNSPSPSLHWTGMSRKPKKFPDICTGFLFTGPENSD